MARDRHARRATTFTTIRCRRPALVCGIGTVRGVRCMIVANDATVKGGTYYPLTVKKHLRAQEIALENRLPCIYLVDSGGAFLPLQDEVFPDREHFGRIFYNQAQLSARGIPRLRSSWARAPQAAPTCLPCATRRSSSRSRARSISPARRSSRPRSARTSTTRRSAAATCTRAFRAWPISSPNDDSHALELAREIVAHANPQSRTRPSTPRGPDRRSIRRRSSTASFRSDIRYAFNVREVLARIVDRFGIRRVQAALRNHARLRVRAPHGVSPSAFSPTTAILFSESALKGAHFIQLCNRRGMPLLFVQNVAGFMVGKDAERRGIAKDGAKLVTAVACARVPKLTLIIGGSFGAGNYGMCGRAYGPRFLWTWPTSRIAVMGGEQAGAVLARIRGRAAGRQRGRGRDIRHERRRSCATKSRSNTSGSRPPITRVRDFGTTASSILLETRGDPWPESRGGVDRAAAGGNAVRHSAHVGNRNDDRRRPRLTRTALDAVRAGRQRARSSPNARRSRPTR